MTHKVEWTKEAETTLNQTIEYLADKWDLGTINNFLDRVDQVIINITSSPKLYPVYNIKSQVYKCIVNKHITLYYKIVSPSRIDLLSFWNSHQNPAKLNIK